MSESYELSEEEEKIVYAKLIHELNDRTPNLILLILYTIKRNRNIRLILEGNSPLLLRDRIMELSRYIYDFIFNEMLMYLQNRGINSYYTLHIVKDAYSRFSRDITSQILLRVHIKYSITGCATIPKYEIPLLRNKGELPVCI